MGCCSDANVNKQLGRVDAASLDLEMTMADSRRLGSRRCENVGFEVFEVIRAVVGGMWAMRSMDVVARYVLQRRAYRRLQMRRWRRMRRNERDEISLTESLVRTKLCTSMVSVGPASLGFSSGFFPLAMVLRLMVLLQGRWDGDVGVVLQLKKPGSLGRRGDFRENQRLGNGESSL